VGSIPLPSDLVLLQVADGMIQVLMADEYEIPRYQDMADKVIDLIRGLNRTNIDQESLDSQDICRCRKLRVYYHVKGAGW
jgi:predicted nuclease of restriction endonuclease-like RecB superfamily